MTRTMSRDEMIAAIADLERIPKHLREFEEQCALRSLKSVLAAMNAAAARQAESTR